jgi:hypothetical protein
MKFFETHFEEYVNSNKKYSIHPKLNKLYDSFPSSISDLKNLIFYGPKGVGKYTQVLSCIKKYSNSDLKYEKRLTVTFDKEQFMFKISDIHFEIDMSLLGCNSKLLWNSIYNQIIDVVSARVEPYGIIVCKYFHKVHSELLDTFYSYMQSLHNIKIIFILITEHISFIPDNILNNCQIINIPRPSVTYYKKCINNKTPYVVKKDNITGITNIKNINANITQLMNPHETVCNAIIENIKKPDDLKFLGFRDLLYDILIYDLDIGDCIWYILIKLIDEKLLLDENISNILLKTYTFLQYYNNNYRPIYHLENYMYNLISTIHGYKKCN